MSYTEDILRKYGASNVPVNTPTSSMAVQATGGGSFTDQILQKYQNENLQQTQEVQRTPQETNQILQQGLQTQQLTGPAQVQTVQASPDQNWFTRNIVRPVGNFMLGTAPDVIARGLMHNDFGLTDALAGTQGTPEVIRQQIIDSTNSQINIMMQGILSEEDPASVERRKEALATMIQTVNEQLQDDIFRVPTALQTAGAAVTVAANLATPAAFGKAFVGKEIGKRYATNVAGQQVVTGIERAAPTLLQRAGAGATIGGLQAGGTTLAETGDLGEAAKSAAIGSAIGAAFPVGLAGAGKLGSKALSPVIQAFEKPNLVQNPILRSTVRALTPAKNLLKGIGTRAEELQNKYTEWRFTRDSLVSKAKAKLSEFADVYRPLSKVQRDEFFRITQAERSIDKAITMTPDPQVQEAIRRILPMTQEISELQKGRAFLANKGLPEEQIKFAEEAGVFFPIRGEDPGMFSTKTRAAAIKEKADAIMAKKKDITREAAYAEARKLVTTGQEFSKQPASGKARRKIYSSAEDARRNGIETDAITAYEKWIEREAGISAELQTFGGQEQRKALQDLGKLNLPESDGEGFFYEYTPEEIAYRYKEMLLEDVGSSLEENFAKMHPNNVGIAVDEANTVKNILSRTLDAAMYGQKLHPIAKAVKSLNAFKLSTAFLKNFFQPLNVLLTSDLSTFWKGFKSAYGLTSGGKKLATEAGSAVEEVLETEHNSMLRRALNKWLAPLKWTEQRNRIWSATTGMEYANTLAKTAVDNMDNNAGIIAKERLEELIGRKLKPEELVARGGEQALQLSEKDFLRAAWNMTKQTQFGYDVMELPAWANTQLGSVMTQFKSYGYNQLKFVLDQTVNEIRSGNPGRGIRNIALLATIYPIAGEGANALDAMLYGKPTESDLLSVDRWLNNMANVGAFGMLADTLRAPNGPAMLRSAILGPTWSTGESVADIAMKSVGALAGGDIPLEEAFKFASSQFGGAGRIGKALYEGTNQWPTY